jgi:hypothetical protein
MCIYYDITVFCLSLLLKFVIFFSVIVSANRKTKSQSHQQMLKEIKSRKEKTSSACKNLRFKPLLLLESRGKALNRIPRQASRKCRDSSDHLKGDNLNKTCLESFPEVKKRKGKDLENLFEKVRIRCFSRKRKAANYLEETARCRIKLEINTQLADFMDVDIVPPIPVSCLSKKRKPVEFNLDEAPALCKIKLHHELCIPMEVDDVDVEMQE